MKDDYKVAEPWWYVVAQGGVVAVHNNVVLGFIDKNSIPQAEDVVYLQSTVEDSVTDGADWNMIFADDRPAMLVTQKWLREQFDEWHPIYA